MNQAEKHHPLLCQWVIVGACYTTCTDALSQAGGKPRPRALTNASALADLVNELVTTERSYVQRLRLMKELYADPLLRRRLLATPRLLLTCQVLYAPPLQ